MNDEPLTPGKAINILNQRIFELENANRWQPIKTAPADRKRFLATDGKIVDFAYRYGGGFAGSKWGLSKPTHWMPLPKPPEEK